MVSIERLIMMRAAEMEIAQSIAGNVNVKNVAWEYADALGELIAHRREREQKLVALTVEEEGVSPQIVQQQANKVLEMAIWGEQ